MSSGLCWISESSTVLYTVSQAGLWAFHGPTFWGSKAADCRGGQTGNTPSRHHKLKLHPLMNIKSHIIQTSIPGMSLSQSKSVLEVAMISMISMQIMHFFEEDPHIFGRFFFFWVSGGTHLTEVCRSLKGRMGSVDIPSQHLLHLCVSWMMHQSTPKTEISFERLWVVQECHRNNCWVWPAFQNNCD